MPVTQWVDVRYLLGVMSNNLNALLVAASDSPSWVKARADYVCDGTGDEVEINQAFAALPADQGVVVLSAGVFSLAATVTMTGHGQTLLGSGTGQRSNASQGSKGSKLKAVSGFSGTEIVRVQPTANDAPAHGVTLRDFTVDGDAIGSGVDGILFRSHTASIEHVHVHRCTGSGVHVKGYNATESPPSGWATYDTMLSRLIVSNCTSSGVWFDAFAQDCHMVQSVLYNNAYNIRVGAGSQQITGCHTYSGGTYNVWFDGSGSRTKIVNLKCEQAGQHGLFLDGTTAGTSDVMVVGSNFKDNGLTTDNTYDHINFTGGGGSHTRATIVGCNFSWTTGNKARYGINLTSSSAAQNVNVQGNSLSGSGHFGTAPINQPSTVTGTIRGNHGHTSPLDAVVLVGDGSGTKKLWFGGGSQPAGMASGDYWIHDS